jgi:ribonuclease HII
MEKNFKNKIINADSLNELKKIPSISAASIIAKVSRDKFITKLSKEFNNYGWHTNYGYGTKEHLKAIKQFGITKYHRKTFSPISDLL